MNENIRNKDNIKISQVKMFNPAKTQRGKMWGKDTNRMNADID